MLFRYLKFYRSDILRNQLLSKEYLNNYIFKKAT